MNSDSRIYVAGHRGLVGSAICRSLRYQGYHNLILRTHEELDLTQRERVEKFFLEEKPEYIFLAAAKVGGILANNTYPANFIRENLLIQTNVIDASYHNKAKRLLFLGSSCIYPKLASQPMREDTLLTGSLEPTNRPYAIAKIAGIEMCWSYNRQYHTKYLTVMPTNLYGPEDNFDLNNSHVLPALIRKVAEAKKSGEKTITIWGTGTPLREFLYSDDMADACVFLMSLEEEKYLSLLTEDQAPLLNIGSGSELSIRDLAELICKILEFDGQIQFDISKPDGTPRKLLDSTRINNLGWRPKVSLADGIRNVYEITFRR
jgi:GDP-L-fucose synthase